MPRVLLGQDGGDGFGHAARLAPIADALRRQGCTVRLALRAPEAARPLLEPLGLAAVQAPMVRVPARPDLAGHRTAGYVDLLAIYSFDRPGHLLGLVRAWDRLLEAFAPDLVIADFAPGLALAARGTAPVVHVGSGYTVPPAAGERLPLLRHDSDGLPEEAMLAGFNDVQRRRGRPPLASLAELLRGSAAFVTCLPLLDPYAAVRAEPALGPLRPLPAPAEGPPETGYFAYLAADYRGTATALEGLLASGRPGSVYLRNADAGTRDEWRRRGLTVHDAPQPLPVAAGQAAVVVHHGGINTTEAVLALGRPQLFLPRHAEQVLTSEAVMRREAGVRMRTGGRFLPRHLAAALADAALPSTALAARALARQAAAAGPHHGLERVVATCLELLRPRP